MSAKHLSWIGYTCIIIGAILQFIGTLQSSTALSLSGQAVSAISIPFTIWQSHRSALESQQEFDKERQERLNGDQKVWEMTEGATGVVKESPTN
jgi:hypothetical protein